MGPQSATLLTLAASVMVLGMKVVAYLLTGSVALLSDAFESVANLAAALAVLYSIRLARRPADYEHPYGHAKAEYLSAALEGSMILTAAGLILATAVQRLFAPVPLEQVVAGMSVALLATLVNGATALALKRIGRQHRSPALVSNSRHLMTDVWTSVGVIVGVGLVVVSGWEILDPLIAIVVGLNIVREGWSVLTESFSSLLDVRLPEEEENVILDLLEAESQVKGFHRLRSRSSGYRSFVEVDIFVDPRLDVMAAHEIAAGLENKIIGRLPNLTTTVHVEPFLEGERDTTRTPRQEYLEDDPVDAG